MKSKFLFITSAILTSILGFGGGISLTRYIISDKGSIVLTSEYEKGGAEEIPSDIKPEETVLEIKDLPAPQEDKEKVEKVEVAKKPNDCAVPSKDYEDESFMNVGQEVALEDKSYIPDNLIELDKNISKYNNLCVKEEVAQALTTMIADAKKDKLNIIISSGFRDYNTQKDILNTNIASGNKNAVKLIAKPGYSEHQLGVAVDFTSPSIGNVSATGKFGDTKESKWLEAHASEYGFIESYPKGKEDITGYLYEPWHYRYVGIEHAAEIVKNDQTANEYLKAKKESEVQNKTAL